MYKVLIVEDEDIIRKGLLFMVNWQEADCVVVGEACLLYTSDAADE